MKPYWFPVMTVSLLMMGFIGCSADSQTMLKETESKSLSNDFSSLSFTTLEEADHLPLPENAEKVSEGTDDSSYRYTIPVPVEPLRKAYIRELEKEGWETLSDVSPKHIQVKKGALHYHLFLTRSENREGTQITIRQHSPKSHNGKLSYPQ
ncbi:hypothetical protein GXN76_13545 [Kroppenstedtia pulmonis]|uniref:Lipoprotein n=1 Tax=Kroppenstedtia pulmonis TaxID=1380685 RepID=A0A7D3Y663_9BACL|nr:hypothetical protein [Kroppenstedtia pulmonis]QKG85385.1 hypothetical protein GXN76_13545 [Kroppenstedtia pulmonis]